MTAKKTVHYIIRDIDKKFWVRVKIRAAKEGKNIRGFVLAAVDHYITTVKAPKY